jgi:NADPH-dependent ferric siderophore reductase
VGDESSAPATFAMAEALPAGVTAMAVLVAEAGELPVNGPAELDLSWLAEDAVERHLHAVPLPAGTMAYVNGERSLVRRAATVLAARGLQPKAIATKAYWRRDQANAAHGELARD